MNFNKIKAYPQHKAYIMLISEQFASSKLAGKGSNGGK